MYQVEVQRSADKGEGHRVDVVIPVGFSQELTESLGEQDHRTSRCDVAREKREQDAGLAAEGLEQVQRRKGDLCPSPSPISGVGLTTSHCAEHECGEDAGDHGGTEQEGAKFKKRKHGRENCLWKIAA